MPKFITLIHEIQLYWREVLSLLSGPQMYLGKGNGLDMEMDQEKRKMRDKKGRGGSGERRREEGDVTEACS